jgi:hypothetical protein
VILPSRSAEKTGIAAREETNSAADNLAWAEIGLSPASGSGCELSFSEDISAFGDDLYTTRANCRTYAPFNRNEGNGYY